MGKRKRAEGNAARERADSASRHCETYSRSDCNARRKEEAEYVPIPNKTVPLESIGLDGGVGVDAHIVSVSLGVLRRVLACAVLAEHHPLNPQLLSELAVILKDAVLHHRHKAGPAWCGWALRSSGLTWVA